MLSKEIIKCTGFSKDVITIILVEKGKNAEEFCESIDFKDSVSDMG